MFKWFLIICSFLALTIFSLKLRSQNLYFENQPLTKILDSLEKTSGLHFNYNPELLQTYNYSGELPLHLESEKLLEKLLLKTPFDFEPSQQTILIFLPPQKNYKLPGSLHMKSDSSAVPFASIYTKEGKQGTVSDINGEFELNILAHKNETISISCMGLKSQYIPIYLWPELDQSHRIFLETDEFALNQIIIKGYILPGITEGLDFGSTRIDFKTLRRSFSLPELDVLKTVQLLPGIVSTDESATNLNIRGSLPDQNLLLWEGVTLYDAGHLFGTFTAIDPFTAEQVEVYKSIFNPKFENRIGGLVAISLPDSVSNAFDAGFGTTLTTFHAYSKIPLVKDKISLMIAGRHSTSPLFKSPTLDNYSDKIFQNRIIGEESSTQQLGFSQADGEIRFYDFNAKLLYKIEKAMIWENSIFSSYNNSSYDAMSLQEDIRSKEDVLFKSLAAVSRLKMNLTNKGQSEVFISLSTFNNRNAALLLSNKDSASTVKEYSTNNIHDIQFGANQDLKINRKLKLEFGYYYAHQQLQLSLDQNSSSESEENKTQSNTGNFQNFFGTISYKKNKLALMFGIKSTYYHELNNWYWSPRANAQYRLNPKFKLKLSAGLLQQFINQLRNNGLNSLGSNSRLWILSNNETGKILNAKKIACGFIYQNNNWLFDFESYFHLTREISIVSTYLDPDLGKEGIGESKVYGIDILLKKNWNRFKFWANYSLSKNEYYFPEINPNSFPASNDHLHSLGIFTNYKLKNWAFSISYHFNSGLPYSIPTGSQAYTSENGQSTVEKLYYTQLNGARLNNYHRVDAGLNYKSKRIWKRARIELGLSVLNLFNRENIYAKYYYLTDAEGGEGPKTISIEKRQLLRTPQLMLRIFW
jgi:CarboxypepD_reg-like domain/TonB-dependent Receptor Plug Domain/FecR, C-terminal